MFSLLAQAAESGTSAAPKEISQPAGQSAAEQAETAEQISELVEEADENPSL